MKLNQFTRNAAAICAVIIGWYPLMYLGADVYTHGLLHSKPHVLLNNALWSTAFFVHIITGGLALLTGWTQFNAKRRKRRLGLHKVVGRVYAIVVGISGITGLYVAFFATGGLVCAYGFATLAMLWLFTDIMAYASIRQGQVAEHRRWMILNYSLTFAAVTLRLWLPLLIGAGHLDFIHAYRMVAWLCWVPNIALAWWLAKPKAVKQELHIA